MQLADLENRLYLCQTLVCCHVFSSCTLSCDVEFAGAVFACRASRILLQSASLAGVNVIRATCYLQLETAERVPIKM